MYVICTFEIFYYFYDDRWVSEYYSNHIRPYKFKNLFIFKLYFNVDLFIIIYNFIKHDVNDYS